MTRDALKKKIKKKFGSYSNFARSAGLDRYELQRDFLEAKNPKPEVVARIGEIFDNTHVQMRYHVFTYKKRKLLRAAINASGGVSAFCAESGFNPVTVWQVLRDVDFYGTEKPVVRRLLDHFKIK